MYECMKTTFLGTCMTYTCLSPAHFGYMIHYGDVLLQAKMVGTQIYTLIIVIFKCIFICVIQTY